MESKFLLIATYDVTRPRCAGSWRAAAGVCTCPRPHTWAVHCFSTHTQTQVGMGSPAGWRHRAAAARAGLKLFGPAFLTR